MTKGRSYSQTAVTEQWHNSWHARKFLWAHKHVKMEYVFRFSQTVFVYNQELVWHVMDHILKVFSHSLDHRQTITTTISVEGDEMNRVTVSLYTNLIFAQLRVNNNATDSLKSFKSYKCWNMQVDFIVGDLTFTVWFVNNMHKKCECVSACLSVHMFPVESSWNGLWWNYTSKLHQLKAFQVCRF